MTALPPMFANRKAPWLTLLMGLLMGAVLLMTACSKDLEFSQRRIAAQSFLDAIAKNDQAAATKLSLNTAEHRMAIKLLSEAVALRIQNEHIQSFRYVYVSDTLTETNRARAVFSQVVDGRPSTENVVVELHYLPQTSAWLVNNVILR
ncbi:hypothetical protein NQT62_13760 [Limnobacter humi]|uniref:DUF4878 domain-containing protein n=1 Tax=Limnobacter humi TaxID=1778671 RepID=A0ABT1WKM7_9BURK|nr:hypothetical protein [Limnobacter humi]MCQ8897502.1 hypothetical protein [Limnobacter humi]